MEIGSRYIGKNDGYGRKPDGARKQASILRRIQLSLEIDYLLQYADLAKGAEFICL